VTLMAGKLGGVEGMGHHGIDKMGKDAQYVEPDWRWQSSQWS
jgi:hypothetical protein